MAHRDPTPRPVRSAEPARRSNAFLVDRAIAWTLFAAAAVAAWWWLFREDATVAGVLLVVGVVLVVSLVFVIVLGARGVSPGKATFDLRVVDEESGTPIGFGRALVRTLILGAASLPTLGLGTAVLAWTALEDPGGRRRGWHDRVVGSMVTDLRPEPTEDEEPPEEPVAGHVVNLTAMRLMRVEGAPDPGTGSEAPVPAPPAPARPEPAPARPASPPAVAWRLTVDTGEDFVVNGLTLVGRGPEGRPGENVHLLVPLASQDMSISKTHAQFHLANDGTLVVVDRGSTNGSMLVRKGVVRELSVGRPTTLLDGDKVVLGDRELWVFKVEN